MELFLTASLGDADTAPIVWTLFALFLSGVCALVWRWLRVATIPRVFVAGMPSVLSTVGVLGTFYGIWLGLLDFDVAAIDSSVPMLLTGLKTAFVTSLWGMALSVVFRLLSNLTPVKAANAGSTLAALSTLIDEQRTTRASSERALENLRQAIAGDEDSTLASQVGKLRNESHAAFQALRTAEAQHHQEHMQELREFARHMVENTNKALVTALEDVIRDFNNSLTEQFGENFKQLNEAVHALVAWQDNYREHVDSMENRIAAAVRALQSSEVALRSVAESTTAIAPALDPLGPTLSAIKQSLSRINEDLASYSDLHDKARAAFPLVNENLDAMTSGLRSAIESMLDRTDTALQRQRTAHDDLDRGYETMAQLAGDAQRTFNTALDTTMDRVGTELQTMFERTATSLQEGHTDTDRRLRDQIRKVDEALGEELENALGILARHLGSMSEKFVTDYEPLTLQLQSLVRLAEAANDPGGLQKHG